MSAAGAVPRAPTPAPAGGERRCRRRPVPLEGGLRPTDVVGAFFVGGVAFLAAASVAGVVQAVSPWSWGRWLALHLAFVGGVSQLVLGASQFFVGAFLATDPPRRALVRGQLAAWNLGAALLAVAVPAGWAAGTWAAVAIMLAGLALWGAAIAAMRRKSLRSAPWATHWYVSGAAFLAAGLPAGALIANGAAWGHGDLLAAHVALNVGGWFGAAIVGTLHTFYPSLTRTEMRFPGLQPLAFAAWAGGVALLAAGYGLDAGAAATAGWLALCLGALLLLANVAASFVAAPRPLSLAARLVGLAQPFLLAGLVVAAAASLADGPAQALAGGSRAGVGTLLVAGWVGLTVLGSLLHLLAVVVRVRGGFRASLPDPRPRSEAALAAAAVLGVALVALRQGGVVDWGVLGTVVLVAAYAVLAAKIARLAVSVLLRARPSL